ncbi:hypothetical protein [Agromyces salentinus]|uniref:Polysaccharide pyruvyl transferase family protein n=1 Tax=Agromyces salentinus TaxID=269421 RepID=A0ABN2MUZ9_9MICO|nr:hypothetical protein [Agromyces salentinus]
MNKIFAVGRGQYENVGDIILRRPLLDWVRPLGQLHVYVGHSPAGYDEGLGLAPDDVVYRSFTSWYRAAMAAAVAGEASYVFKPGEIQLTLIGMKEHVSMLPLLATIRLRGGRAVRAGVGTRNYAPVPRAIMGPSIALSDLTLWRDVTTAAYMRRGEAMPDLAFGEGAPDDLLPGFAAGDGDRDVMVVSMRADDAARPYPTTEWIEGVRGYAERHGLEIWAVTQVQVDNETSYRLARDLGGQVLAWDELSGHDVQEAKLRELYRRTAIALSDRLHVIIAAFTEGAIPVGSLVDASDKIERHFATIGITDITLATRDMSAEQIVTALESIAARREDMFERLGDARARLVERRMQVQETLRGAASAGLPVDAAAPTEMALP